MSKTRDFTLSEISPSFAKEKVIFACSSPVVFVIIGVPRILPSSMSGIPDTKIASLCFLFWCLESVYYSQCSIAHFGTVNVASIVCTEVFLTFLPAVHVLLIKRVAFPSEIPLSVKIALMNAVHWPDDRLNLSPMFNIILLVNEFLSSFNAIDGHDGLGLLLWSHTDPVVPLLVEGNTNY